MRFLLFLLLSPLSLYCRQQTYHYHQEVQKFSYTPWFTGTVLPPSAVNAAPNHPIFAPIFFFTLKYGQYENNWKLKTTDNTWSINPYFEFLFGLNDFIGVDIYASFISNFKHNQNSTHFLDTMSTPI